MVGLTLLEDAGHFPLIDPAADACAVVAEKIAQLAWCDTGLGVRGTLSEHCAPTRRASQAFVASRGRRPRHTRNT